jgi:integrase
MYASSEHILRGDGGIGEGFQKLIAGLKTPFNSMALVSVCLGLRVSELLALKWCDVDWLGAKLNIERGIVKQVVDDVKTDSSRNLWRSTGNCWRC